ncbi:tetratricopeptide repeat protein [Mucilaginibacter yixingensis]|uniref:Tetratricopeptide repeat protein n=1 Tax=Mucilaginibacter yixingensis TaxID=1295612 RepID=A0A2T5J7R2_9SPHI|nr:tetratricopeptide repeat protein [Mucilaginibacter yixingensis]PTQ95503.1 tetratricopeptide repeat protein [Mucilaginibacter yixingensis]
METLPYELFTTAVTLLQAQVLIEAFAVFQQIADDYPDHELADDALYNAGLCQFQLNNFPAAVNLFEELIRRYPEATIYDGHAGREFGRTAAKAHYALINCHLRLGQVAAAIKESVSLQAYPESYVLSELGQPVYYHDLAQTAIQTYQQLS